MKAAGAGVGALALGGFSGSATASVGNPTPRLSTDGKWIVNPDGERVKLRGFSTASLDFTEIGHSEGWIPYSVEEVLERATDGEKWHPNTVRIPITEDPVHDHGMDYVVEDLLRPAIDYLADRGVYAMIDFHLIRPYVEARANAEGMTEDGWADDDYSHGFNPDVETDDLLVEFWDAVAPEFADDEHVIYELYNEPTLPVAWSTYGDYGPEVTSREDSWLLWRDVAQPWVDLIREHAPETPIIIGSPHWTSETQFAPEYPFEGENLIYASHIYPDNGYPGEFDEEYGAPAEEVPVVCTEFGWDPDEEFRETVEFGTTSEWGSPFIEWLESYDNMGWQAWCFDWAWQPTFFDETSDGWELKDGEEQMGWYIRDVLEDTKDDMIVGESDGDDDDDAPSNLDVTGDGNPAQDLSGDGLYEDITGDGNLGFNDVVEFFENHDGDVVQNNVEYFDFSGSGSVGFNDVVALFEML
ncbi:hypothetical protein GCM10025298_32580 [Natronobiforma cellulositropha]